MLSKNQFKMLNRALLTSTLTISMFSFPLIANANITNGNVDLAEKGMVETSNMASVSYLTEVQRPSLPEVTYKKLAGKKGRNSVVVYINNKQAVWFLKGSGNYTPQDRAKVFVNRLNSFLAQNGDKTKIMPGRNGNSVVIRADGQDLLTVDSANAKAFGLSQAELSFKWVNGIRKALNVPVIVRDYTLVASRSGLSPAFATRFMGREQVGVASWYGGRFHGRRAADGSRFNTYELTAAHKTLPFGTLVKVTNLKNKRTCIVRINDRGPYVRGRVIDLSRDAAREIGVLGSGIGYVKLEVIGKY